MTAGITTTLLFTISIWIPGAFETNSIDIKPGKLIYQNDLSSEAAVKDWIMEGPGKLQFEDGWMEMYSPEEQW